MLKNAGREKKNKKFRKYRPMECECCNHKIDVDLCIKNNDYDELGNGEINIYCEECGCSNTYKL